MTDAPETIDEYIAAQAPAVRPQLQRLRRTILKAAPQATERISYRMPAFHQGETLVYFAAYARHIGFYPTAQPMVAFAKELTAYKTSKGAVQFPLDQPLPLDLVTRMVAYRVAQAAAAATARKATAPRRAPR